MKRQHFDWFPCNRCHWYCLRWNQLGVTCYKCKWHIAMVDALAIDADFRR